MTTEPEQGARASEPEAKRQSGNPGGGQGRIDTVGRGPVYPASGPFPSGDAEVRTEGSLVQGERDAEGREVEGGSEIINLGDNTVLGGPTPGSSSPPLPSAQEPIQEKPPEESQQR